MSIDVKKLCEDSHRISKDKGWLDGSKRSYAGVISLIHSELSEALEDYRNNLPLNQRHWESKDEHGKTLMLWPKDYDAEHAAHNKWKPCGIPSELADVIIRIAQHCGTERHEDILEREVKISRLNQKFSASDFEDLIAKAHSAVSMSFNASLRGSSITNVVSALADAWELVETFCTKNDINLEAAVLEKQAFNETRPHRHGGKKI
jgi:hypothetical protein